ncbi:MAG: hypothetical protein IKA05_04520 [Clostridia bacterium]|nr:hypothetical protein [Clostridia bacterium]
MPSASNVKFSGILDGNGQTINYGNKYVTSGKTMASMLFYTLQGSAQIKNVTLANLNIVGSDNDGRVGLVACDLGTAESAIFSNITVTNVNFTHNGSGEVDFGGLMARYTKTYPLTIENCNVTVNASIADGKTGSVGGLFGAITNGNISISGCTVNGILNGGTNSAGAVTGSLGETEMLSISITNTTVNAAVSGKNAGGFFGEVSGVATISAKTSISNTGAISGTNAGGFIGSVSNAANITVWNFENQGAVSGTNVGGLVGALTKKATFDVRETTNTGTLTGTHTHARVGYIALADLFTVAAPTLRADGGLDFNVTIDKELLSDVTVVGGTQVGMMITLSSNIPATGFTTVGMAALGEPTDANSAYYMNKSAAWNTLFDLEEDQTFKAYISNVKTENAEKEFSCVAYVTFEYNGGEYTVYSSVATGTPSALASAT